MNEIIQQGNKILNDSEGFGVTKKLNDAFSRIAKMNDGILDSDLLVLADAKINIHEHKMLVDDYQIPGVNIIIQNKDIVDETITSDKIGGITIDTPDIQDQSVVTGKLKIDLFHEKEGDISQTWLDQRFVKIYNTIVTQFNSSKDEFNQNALVFCYKE